MPTDLKEVMMSRSIRQLASLGVLVLASVAYAAGSEAVNTDKTGLGLGGYDPVSYFTDGKPAKGDYQFASNFEGVTYWFASAENKKTFDASPARYLPQFGGYCAFGVTKSKKLNGDPMVWKIVDGKLYLNVNPRVAKLFDEGTAGHIATADKNWPAIKDRPAADVNK